MSGVSRQFMLLAVAFLLAGIVLGLHMAISTDHALTPAHAHIMLAGWASSALFAIYYHLHPQVASTIWSRVHFWLGSISVVIMNIALVLLYSGMPQAEAGAAMGSIGFAFSIVIFARNVVLART